MTRGRRERDCSRGAARFDLEALRGGPDPVFVGCAVTNFGVQRLLDAIVDLSPAPRPRSSLRSVASPLAAPFSGFVFKIQANMDPRTATGSRSSACAPVASSAR